MVFSVNITRLVKELKSVEIKKGVYGDENEKPAGIK
jgi:hypothetical protein